ncbi:MAG: GspE/PulE family protein [Minisyncoccia bacterium]
MLLVDELVRVGYLTEVAGNQALEEYRGVEDEVPIDSYVEKYGITEDQLLKARSNLYGIPIKKIDAKTIDLGVLKYIAQESALQYKFIPLAVNDGILEVGMVDPEFLSAKDALQFISSKIGLPYTIVLVAKSDFDKAMELYRGLSGEVDKALEEYGVENLDDTKDKDVEKDLTEAYKAISKEKDGNAIVEDAPVTKIVSVVLRHALEQSASDIHIEHVGDKVKVRFRIDGVLETNITLPPTVHSAVIARIKIMASLKLDEKRKPQDGRFSSMFNGHKIDFRVSSLPTYYGEKVVIRILDSYRGVKPLEDVGFTPEALQIIRTSAKRPYGLILVSGPTGSGKTTTLYSMLNEIDREEQNVVSLEDPVEYNIPGLNQSQIMPEIGYTFATGLRSILRQDPDVIMVGEIRDKETAQLAIQAALTGHLVLSTIHTNSAIGVIPRLIDMGVDPYLIAPTLILAMAQRLVPKIEPSCKKVVPHEESMRLMVEKQFASLPEELRKKLNLTRPFHEAVGNDDFPSGTKGRAAVLEILPITKEIEHVILNGAQELELEKVARAQGMLTMKEDALIKSMEGIVPLREAYNL